MILHLTQAISKNQGRIVAQLGINHCVAICKEIKQKIPEILLKQDTICIPQWLQQTIAQIKTRMQPEK